MEIFLTNTLTGKKELFEPIRNRKVGMYNCGPTVYDRAHIGNLRSYVFADVLKRMFEFNGYKVKQIINITDVGHLTSDADEGEDKLEKSAKQKGRKTSEIVEKYTNLFFEDIKKLNINTKKIKFPKATDHIKLQIKLIKKLEKKGYTYKTSDGIYFDTSKFISYGKLGGINTEGLKEGARVVVNKEKKNPTDFALWKFSRKGENREQEWKSPWGIGFPGWHIECSAMAKKYLGQPFDIHTGGVDHIPVHHNNEIAQSESLGDKPLANYWMHNNHLTLNDEKIAKSTGNTLYISDLEKDAINPIVFRYWLLTSHYSSLVNFSNEVLAASNIAFQKLVTRFKNVKSGKINSEYITEINAKINNDLNTPGVLAIIWLMLKDKKIREEDKYATILEADNILGLNIKEAVKSIEEQDNIPKQIVALAKERKKARDANDFERADKLREKIQRAGFEIKDTESGFDIFKQVL